jgi:hypothetical protein
VSPEDLAAASRSIFERHRIEAFGGIFHVPEVERYPALFAWDSGYHALACRHFDPELAVGELTTLYRANRLPNGLLSHQRYIPGAEKHQALIERLFGPMFDGDRTPFIDPPTAAFAAARLSLSLGSAVDGLLDAAIGHLRAIQQCRTVNGSSLPAALHPFETGTEGSAMMRPLLPGDLERSLELLKDLTVSAIAAELSPERALANGHSFVVYDPTICGWFLLALEEAAAACRARARLEDAKWAEYTSAAVADELERLTWWEEGQLFVAYDVVAERQLPGVGAMGMISAASRYFADRGLSGRVANRHLQDRAPLWGPYGFAAGLVTSEGGVRQYVQWDGNAVWGATVYWAHLLAARVERWDVAHRLRSQLEFLIGEHGFREFYDACTSEPGGAGSDGGFTWPALVLEMAAAERS